MFLLSASIIFRFIFTKILCTRVYLIFYMGRTINYYIFIVVNQKWLQYQYYFFGSDKMDKYMDKWTCRRTSSFQHVTYPADKW